ncbi:MAG: GIY-YIG nuclease family protein [Rhodospirillales bacterium]|nr:GIY-YIG nuclease family protein [Alphaproteobacteria bacterium]MCB9981632.1 GIY-YIG nuclease family protein [Rhodospirillales bacterium]
MYVYMLASKKYGTIYTGVTSDLVRRVWEHKQGIVEGFTKQHDVKDLVYYEQFDDPENAIRREKQIKNWKRQWKINVINEYNPHWEDLYNGIATG